MKLDRDDWAQVLRHLDTALQLPAGERLPWLQALAPSCPPLHVDALRELLADRCAIETADFLGAGAAAGMDAAEASVGASDAAAAPGSPRRVGPWVLLREVGRGGMATVWLARRADGAHAREVALKLPHPRGDAQTLLKRFVRERAILSTLQHPHIAQVLDAGESDGQPWLALEYVDGRPITSHAMDQRLDLRARLVLFLPVLRAVQHAHGQLVIHRDIKPANVMVSVTGEVKLLDFGVAKLLGEDGLGTDTALTREGGHAMTLQYASPEQIAGRPLGMASDVYALGVLLYELLTERLPYTLPSHVRPSRAAALEEAILTARVLPPSAATPTPSLARALRGDIDTIVLKALHMDPSQRYTSAVALAEDIERYLQRRPILARPQRLGYRMGRLWQRQRVGLSAALALLLAMTVGVGGTLWQADKARDEARRARAVQDFLVKLLQTADPQGGLEREMRVGELLDISAARIDREFAGQPDVKAQLLHTLANIYVERGEPLKGRPLLERAIELHAQSGADGREAHVQALVDRAELLDELNDYAAERVTLDQAAALAEKYFGSSHRWAAQLLAARAWLAMTAGQLGEARRLGELAEQRFGPPSPQSLRTSGSLATIYIALGDLEAAQGVLERAVRGGQALGGQGSIDRLMDGYNLARVQFILGQLAQAEAGLAELMPQFDSLAGRRHERTLLARGLWAQVLAARGRVAEGLEEARANLTAALAAHALEDDTVQVQRATLAMILRQAGRPDEALPLAREALAATERRYSAPTSQREAIRRVLGEVLLATGQRDEGVAVLETALRYTQQLKPGGADLQQPLILQLLAVALRDTRPAEASAWAARACAMRAQQMSARQPALLRCRTIEAWLQARTLPEAERAAGRARFAAAREQLLGAVHELNPLRAELLAAEAELLPASEAARLRLEADRQYRQLVGVALPPRLLVLH